MEFVPGFHHDKVRRLAEKFNPVLFVELSIAAVHDAVARLMGVDSQATVSGGAAGSDSSNARAVTGSFGADSLPALSTAVMR